MPSKKEAKVTLTLTLPPSFRAAIYAESNRAGSTPSKVVEEVLVRYLPRFVSEQMRSDLDAQHMVGPQEGEET
jgi:hypothetical protein